MDDIAGLVSQILNDPEQLQQIMELAQNLSPVTGEQDASPITPERVAEIGNMLLQSGATDPKHEALVRALRPFLRPGRQTKLDRAMQIARLSHIAGIALKKEFTP